MKNPFAKKQVTLVAACALALGVFSSTTIAQMQPVQPGSQDGQALLKDSQGQFVMSGTGVCWHSATGPAPLPNYPCGPQPIAQYVPAPQAYVAPVAVAPVAVYEKMVFDTNVLFDFDKSTLRPASRDALDGFISRTRGFIDPDSMVAVGYADRIGGSSYNQTLSEDRVAAVKAYLVSQGIQSSKVSTSGKGETQPTTAPSECDGLTNSRSIACLQPDRHVFIELSGVRLKQ